MWNKAKYTLRRRKRLCKQWLIWRWAGQVYHYSGLKAVIGKFKPPERGLIPSGPLWLIGIYVAVFGLASQRYEFAIERGEIQAALITAQLSTSSRREALQLVPALQNRRIPYKPELFKPWTTVQSLYKDSVDTVRRRSFMNVLVSYKASLSGLNLEDSFLNGANLDGAFLDGAFLDGTDLTGARNLTVKQLVQVMTLYAAELDDELREPLEQDYPHLFEDPYK